MEKDSQQVEDRILKWDFYWKLYEFNIKKNWKNTLLALNGSSWPVKSFIKSNAKVRGLIHSLEVSDDVILIAPEVISRSINSKFIFRIIVFDNHALVQEDVDKVSLKLFLNFLCPIFDIKPDNSNVKEIRINAMKIRKLSKHITPVRLTLLVNNQTAGVEGLEQLTLTGDNVIRGIKTLADRQEVDLKADSIGPWIDLASESLQFTMGKGIKLNNHTNEVFNIIKSSIK